MITRIGNNYFRIKLNNRKRPDQIYKHIKMKTETSRKVSNVHFILTTYRKRTKTRSKGIKKTKT